jgi:methionyl-tRNA synthetase
MTLLAPGRRPSGVDHLLVGGIPTPNGPTHLGHIGGTYLGLDLIARFQRMLGNRAYLISGTDGYESHVRVAAAVAGVPPAEIAHRYHAEIEADLRAIDIGQDAFVNPLDERWADRYAGWHRRLLDRLTALGRIEWRTGRLLYSHATGRHLLGGLLAGRCPDCGAGAGGSGCEECGQWFPPGAVLDPRPALGDADLEWRAVTDLYVRLDGPALARARAALAAPDLPVWDRYLARRGPYAPTTAAADHGVPVPGLPAVFFTYGLGTPAYAALFGEEYGRLSGRDVNALAPDSGVVCVSSVGFDCLVPELWTRIVLDLLGPELRPFDHLPFSRFLLLEGSKFSTSRRHAIWTRAATSAVDSDLLRYHLARIHPGQAGTDFRVDDFVASTNRRIVDGLDRQAGRRWDVLAAAAPPAVPAAAPDSRWVRRLSALLERQAAALDPARLRPAAAVQALDEWPTEGGDGSVGEAYWWLTGAAVLAWPVLPRWARATWQRLGQPGDPNLAAFWQRPAPLPGRPRPGFTRLDPAVVRGLAGG